MASRSASSAVGSLAISMAGCWAVGPTCVVVWPFSSVEREKMTLPDGMADWAGCGTLLCGAGAELVCAAQGSAARATATGTHAIAQARKNFMNPLAVGPTAPAAQFTARFDWIARRSTFFRRRAGNAV